MKVPPRPSAAALGGKKHRVTGTGGTGDKALPGALEAAAPPVPGGARTLLPRPSLTGRYIPRAAAAAPEATLREWERTAPLPASGPRPHRARS